jgi:hypothetical protein
MAERGIGVGIGLVVLYENDVAVAVGTGEGFPSGTEVGGVCGITEVVGLGTTAVSKPNANSPDNVTVEPSNVGVLRGVGVTAVVCCDLIVRPQPIIASKTIPKLHHHLNCLKVIFHLLQVKKSWR